MNTVNNDGVQSNFKEEIFQVIWEIQKQGLSHYTIKNINKKLKVLAKNCDLNNPEQVRGYIAKLDKKDGYKRALCYAYNKYVEFHKLSWTKPIYYQPQRLPKIPLLQDINTIISNASKKLSTALSISRDTGLRPIELTNLTLKHLDLNKGIIYPETAKHGTPRALKIKKETLNMLNNYIETKNLNINDRIFGKWSANRYGALFRHCRNTTAKKLGKSSLKTIRLYDLRHFFATMLYRETRDILYVKQQLGHNNIKNTLIYTQLLMDEETENYTCKVAKTIEEATQLIESGFEYVTEMDGVKLFKKRK
ncbi:MAG: site-specific integrase [Candidatus Bathyarchaeia archaeon]